MNQVFIRSLVITMIAVLSITMVIAEVRQSQSTASTTQPAASSCGSGCGQSSTNQPQQTLASKLKLTTAQQKSIADIEKKRDAQIGKLQPLVAVKSATFMKLLHDPNASNDAVDKAFQELCHAQIEMQRVMIFSLRSVDNVYTPEQRAILYAPSNNSACSCGSSPDKSCDSSNGGCGASSSGCGGGCGPTDIAK